MSLYFLSQKREVGMEGRLSAREANPIDPIP
jgi:hypothetical protein